MKMLPSIFHDTIKIKVGNKGVLIYTKNSWTEALKTILSLVIWLAVFKLVGVVLAAVTHRFERDPKEEDVRITQMALLIQRELKSRIQTGVGVGGQTLLQRRQQIRLWRSLTVEEKVKLISNMDLRRRSGTFFLED
ncbi:hypothetical protein BofuT4_P035390.1 [Botrytis cinerea T4]|uniref:Uncharacterized protein n=1 Tax=Botryotinia fuckeliana (strain T4) TaxID=999810 RepID=G2Y6J4_BOTF4|nr:hypothetical protein BofuT4_P035390.1 [Botrytis cinerea T4]